MAGQTFVDFVERTCRVDLTPAQRVLALVAIDGREPERLEGDDRDIARELFGNVETIPPEARGVLCIVKGARIGGTYVFGALYSLWRALTADLHMTAKGEVAVAMIAAPDLELARQCLDYVTGAIEAVPAMARRVEESSAYLVKLRRPDGKPVAIRCRAASRGGSALRGRTLVSAVLSETAFFRDANAVVNDVDCYKAVAPRVIPGGLVVLESTPWAESGLLYEMHTANFSEPHTAMAAHAPTTLMRPDSHTRSLVARERERDPDNAAREFDAQFITGGSGLFLGPELIRPAVLDIEPELAARAPGRVFIGGDIGLVTDASAFVAVKQEGDAVTVVDCLEMRPQRGKPLKLSEVIANACNFAERHGQKQIIVDHHELQAAREHLPQGFQLTPCAGGADAKAERFHRLRDRFRAEQVRIPSRFAKLTGQLGLIVSKPLPGGGTQFVLPRRAGTHLDLCAAFVLAMDAATRPTSVPRMWTAPRRRASLSDLGKRWRLSFP